MKIEYYFLEEDFIALKELVDSLQKKIVELGKEQGVAAGQSTENFGHDDACQEAVYQERRIVVERLNEMSRILTRAVVINPIHASNRVYLGSTVELSNGKTYRIGSHRVLAKHSIRNISYDSPLGQKLLSKSEGDEITHNGTIITVLHVT